MGTRLQRRTRGQKFIVPSIVSDIGQYTDVKDGDVFSPHVLMAASSVWKRQTPGQLYEAWAAMPSVGNASELEFELDGK